MEVVIDRDSSATTFTSTDRQTLHRLHPEGNGYWAARIETADPDVLYKFRIDGRTDRTFPDPASRFQPFGVHGPSQVVDPSRYTWTDGLWHAPAFEDLVFYELHVGTFSEQGTFRGVIERLGSLVELGITAIELMPVASFAGNRNWGYDGAAIYSPTHCYGTPDDLRALVDAAHGYGLAVFLDVVYNHFGPDGAYANAFSEYYFTDAHCSPWGKGVNLDGPYSSEVRRFFIENALHWVRDYHVDGLRLDATHALVDDSPTHFLAELTTTVRERAGRPVFFVAEDHRNLAEMLQPVDAGGYGIDAVWADDFHHQARVHAAGDREGYYADFSGSARDLVRTIGQGWFFTGQFSTYLEEPRGTDPAGVAPPQFVICIQNHDQVGNRADGARLNHETELPVFRALSALLLMAPQTPLLFMGQEWAAQSPFLFFTDHNEELGPQITAGRRNEFRSFAAFADDERRASIPDPQAEDTFRRSRLDWAEAQRAPHDGVRRLYRRLLEIRRTSAAFRRRSRDEYVVRALDQHTIALIYLRDGLTVVARLSGPAAKLDTEIPGTRVVLTTEDPDFTVDSRPIAVNGPRAEFQRPGAVVLIPAGSAVRC